MSSSAPQLVRLASRRAASFGAASVAELACSAGVSEARARGALAGAEFLDDDWFWLPARGRNRLVALSRRILAVASPLDAATIRAGVSRTYPRRRDGLVPPVGVMDAFHRAHPSFAVDEQGRIRPTTRLDHRAELGEIDRLFVDVLRSSWTGVLDRADFRDACIARGMTARTFGAGIARSAVLDQPAADIWCLRGTRISAITAAALRQARAAGLVEPLSGGAVRRSP